MASSLHFACRALLAVSLALPYSLAAPIERGAKPPGNVPQLEAEAIDLAMYARIRKEGFAHSHVMQFAAALSDVIGPRLTNSPNMAKGRRFSPRKAAEGSKPDCRFADSTGRALM